jgi:DNA-binding response OmpR family regulator
MRKTVLLIDDSETVLGLLGEALREAGFEVHAESDVIHANRHLYRSRVDLVLLDVQMPMLSGAEVCRILKGREETRGVPVLFCSDLPEDELGRLVEECGAQGYLSKSLSFEDIVSEVSRRLS